MGFIDAAQQIELKKQTALLEKILAVLESTHAQQSTLMRLQAQQNVDARS